MFHKLATRINVSLTISNGASTCLPSNRAGIREAHPLASLLYFLIDPRRERAEKLVAQIRRCSRLFKKCVRVGDATRMMQASKAAWDAMVNLSNVLRNGQDHGSLAPAKMQAPTGFVVSNLTAAEQGEMIARARVRREHSACASMNLREALNKIAHYDEAKATYRVRRRSHYLVLGGRRPNGENWVAEIPVAQLCTNAAEAVKAMTETQARSL